MLNAPLPTMCKIAVRGLVTLPVFEKPVITMYGTPGTVPCGLTTCVGELKAY